MMGLFFYIMDNEIYDEIEWEISSLPSCSSSGDDDDWILEFDAKGVDEHGNEIEGTAWYTEKDGQITFNYVDYELPEDEDNEEDDEE
jgi:hypothetical protein